MKKKITKRKIREFDEVILFETSAVGLASYPYAHKSLSLVKSLKDLFPDLVSDKLNVKEKHPMGDEENQPQDASETPEETETSEDKPEETTEESKEETPEEAEDKPEADAEATEEGSEEGKNFSPKVMTEMMAKAISEGLAKGMAAIQTKAGLVDKSPAEKQKELLKEAPIGALVASAFEMDKHI